MSFFKKLFGLEDDKKSAPDEKQLPWITPADNIWHLKLLDLRPISENMLATSTDRQQAENAISYMNEDGHTFWGQPPHISRTVDINLAMPTAGRLYPGVLFMPDVMDNKWAIYFDGEQLIFVRSWLRTVVLVAKTVQKENELLITQATGALVTDDETPAFTKAVLNFLLISHVLEETVPAPLPRALEGETYNAGLWAFSAFGNMAHLGVFDETFIPAAQKPLRSQSLLHIAAAHGNAEMIAAQVQAGIDIDAPAQQGMTPLHWALQVEEMASLKKLIALGANVNAITDDGTTPLMSAVQLGDLDKLQLLLQAGADVNKRDERGFTALHRAAEMGHLEIVKILLEHGADKLVAVNEYTALSLATIHNRYEIIALLED